MLQNNCHALDFMDLKVKHLQCLPHFICQHIRPSLPLHMRQLFYNLINVGKLFLKKLPMYLKTNLFI